MALIPVRRPAAELLGLELGSIADAAATFHNIGEKGAVNTARAYQSDLRIFAAFCDERNLRALPATATTLIEYATYLATTPPPRKMEPPQMQGKTERTGRGFATIKRHLAAIQKQHKLLGAPSALAAPELAAVLKGIARILGKKQKQAPTFTVQKLRQTLEALNLTTPAGVRDRALLLLGFAGAFRRSELVALNVEQLTLTEKNTLSISMAGSKTNQYGEEEIKVVFSSPDEFLCPVRAVQAWRELLGRESGPLFVRLSRGTTGEPSRLGKARLSTDGLNRLVQKHLGAEYSAHSLRAAFVTVAVEKGKSNKEIKNQAKHISNAMIERYTPHSDEIEFNAASDLFS